CLRDVGFGLSQILWGARERELYAAVDNGDSCVASEVFLDHFAGYATNGEHVGAGVIFALCDSGGGTHPNSNGQGLACILDGCNSQGTLGVSSKLSGIYVYSKLSQVLDGTDLAQHDTGNG